MSNSPDESVFARAEVLSFPNTIRLRLSLQYISDLALLLQDHALPRLKHLHITLEIEKKNIYQSHNRFEDSSRAVLCLKDFNVTPASLPHLRTLQLRQVPIRIVLTLLEHLTVMSQVRSFILINCIVKGMSCCCSNQKMIKTFLADSSLFIYR